MTETATARRYGHHIDGETVEAESTIERHAPATGELIATYADGSRDAAERAIGAARRAFDEGPWPRLAGLDRGRVLSRLAQLIREHAEELARIDADEVGKPIRIARGDIDGAAGHCEYAAGLAAQVHGDSYTNLGAAYTAMIAREPAGVAGLIIPWNFPALILCQKLPYALAAGCTVVVKPSEYTSGSARDRQTRGRGGRPARRRQRRDRLWRSRWSGARRQL
jgi:betaine-aldehyde dehydrogenase